MRNGLVVLLFLSLTSCAVTPRPAFFHSSRRSISYTEGNTRFSQQYSNISLDD